MFKSKKVFIIGEAGVNHNGSLKKAIKLVDVAVKAKVDAIKFQTFLPGELTGKFTPNVNYLKKLKTKRSKLTSQLALTFKDFEKIKKYCEKKKILFLSTPDGEKSLMFLKNKLKVKCIKIGSSEITNHDFLKLISKQDLPIILSTGISNLNEVREAYNILKKNSKKKIVLLHCTSEYPAPLNEMNIKCIQTLKNSFKCDVGLSDHSLGFEASIVAIALGAKVIEKHFTLSKKLKGPDHAASLSPTELQFFVKTIRRAEKTLGDGVKKPTKSEIKNISGVRRGIVAKVKIYKNSKITSKMITYKRPFIGLAPKDTKKVLNHIALKNFQVDEPIKVKHLKKSD